MMPNSDPNLSVALLNEMVRTALAGLYADLKSATLPDGNPWYRREQEIVSLFAFGHLVPLFKDHSLDAALLTIEGRVPQICGKTPKETPKLRGQRDLVVWSSRLDGYWREPKPKPPINPFAIMEWKLSTGKKTSIYSQREYKRDVEWFSKNAHLMQVGYAVFVQWPETTLRISCTKIENGKPDEEFAILPTVPAS
jgi:hypothetical protein